MLYGYWNFCHYAVLSVTCFWTAFAQLQPIIQEGQRSYPYSLKAKLFWLFLLSCIWWNIFPTCVIICFTLAFFFYLFWLIFDPVFLFCVCDSICVCFCITCWPLYVCVFVCLFYIDWQKWRARIVHSSRIVCLLMKVCEYDAAPTLWTPSFQPHPFTEIICIYMCVCVFCVHPSFCVLRLVHGC